MLTGGLTLLATVLSVGGVTGGISRLVRNNPAELVGAALVLLVLSVAIAAVSRLFLTKRQAILALLVSAACFAAGTGDVVYLMVNTTTTEDRPALDAQIVANRQGTGWVLKADASTSGLKSQELLQVFVYAQPASNPSRGGPAPTPTPGSRPVLEGDRLLFAQAGPNADGVASQTVELPLPAKAYTSYVVTANLGDKPRDCEGAEVEADATTVQQTDTPTVSKQDGLSVACVVIAAPPPPVPGR